MTRVNVHNTTDWDRIDWSNPDLTEVVVNIDDPYTVIDGTGRCDTNTGIAVVVDSRIGVVKNVGHLVVKPHPIVRFHKDNLRIKNCTAVNVNDGVISYWFESFHGWLIPGACRRELRCHVHVR